MAASFWTMAREQIRETLSPEFTIPGAALY